MGRSLIPAKVPVVVFHCFWHPRNCLFPLLVSFLRAEGAVSAMWECVSLKHLGRSRSSVAALQRCSEQASKRDGARGCICQVFFVIEPSVTPSFRFNRLQHGFPASTLNIPRPGKSLKL